MDFNIIAVIGSAVLGAAISLVIVRINKNYKEELERRRLEILEKGEKEAAEILKKASQQKVQLKKAAEDETKRIEEQLNMIKRTLSIKGDLLSKREKRNDNQKAVINQLKAEIRKRKTEIE